ncbi:hypothetical protein RJ639_015256 [Escallonia herrerae]|uniref:GBF-interacting protein 1 N-terminal domain-containing protein n=1 Tax=Escallonia herrerae TaxID=1293975 RepID=A0AA88VI45_9ASTE|nr:hypothetical protein RJ639_015256 [Escallonia herrerae]
MEAPMVNGGSRLHDEGGNGSQLYDGGGGVGALIFTKSIAVSVPLVAPTMSGGGSRVLITSNDRGMIKQIREVTAKHSDDEIYAMLKECNMDPDAAAQKLLYLGTPPTLRVVLGHTKLCARILTATGCFVDTFHEVKSKRDRRKASLNSRASGTQWRGTRVGRGNYTSDAGGGRNVGARKENGNTSGAPRATGSSITSVNGPTSLSSGTSNEPTRAAGLNVLVVDSASANGLTSVSTWSSSRGPAPRPFAGQCIVDETSAALSVVVSGTNGTSQLTENNLLFEQLAFFPTHDGSLAFIPNQEHVNGVSKVVASDPATEAVANSKPLHENDIVVEEATSELDLKLQKLNLSDQPVIFPDHLQVPEALKRGLTFGSLDASIDGEDSESVAEAEAETVQEDDSTAPATQPAGIAQSSVAIPPHLFPFFRHPYSPNYFPYSHFYPHMYFPHSGHHFLGQSGFPQQPSTGNAYIPPAGAAQGVKFPVSSPFEQGSNAGNMTHFGIPSGYGSYGSSPVSYSPSTAVTPGSSASSEDLAASELKEKNVYLTGEDPHAWTSQSQAVRDISGLQANYLYNQHVAFSHAQAGHGAFGGLFHPSQTTPTASIINPFLHQPQTMAESIKPVVPPSGAYQQPQRSENNWSSSLLNRDSIG